MDTSSLCDATVLLAKGQRLTAIRSNGGGLLVFEFDTLTEQQASTILDSREADLCRTFYRAWRDLRKRMDAVTGRESRR
ncbi:MAG: hypothetical protein WCI75_11195 [candidate division NC10 bacterium]